MKKILLALFLLVNTCLIAQNVQISSTRKPNEPSIVQSTKDPGILIAASNLNNYYTSLDTGRTWASHQLTSPYGVSGDPVLDVDTSGNFYFFHLSRPEEGHWLDRIVCQKSSDNGYSWSDGSFTGLNGKKFQDKPWSVVDEKTNSLYLTWTQFDVYDSDNPSDSSVILFSKSTDTGNSWSTPLRINKVAGDCLDDDNTVEGAVPAIGPMGEVYVAWAGPNGIVFNRSLDHGATWLNREIGIDSMPGGWSHKIPGIYRANGLPVTKCDVSGGINNGTIYVNWSDQRNGEDDTDIWLSKSVDGGDTWTKPVRVNNDKPGKHQFFTWMDIDQTSGNLYFVFYDRREHDGNYTDVYLAASTDGGETFRNRKISDSPFLPSDSIFFGDYTNITAHDGVVRPVWTRLHEGQLSIWTDITPFDQTLLFEDNSDRSKPVIHR